MIHANYIKGKRLINQRGILMKNKMIDTKAITTRTLIIGIESPYNPLSSMESYFEEFRNLVKSSGRAYQHELYIKLRSIDHAYYLTAGKLKDVIKVCSENKIDEVVISEPLTTTQERSLSKLLNCDMVIDRTHLILDIFDRGAQSAEGKTQVALARFQFMKGRLAGRGAEMSQQSGFTGTRGPGETQKEKDTQHLERMMVKLKRDLKHLEQVRETQRKRRVNLNIPQFCLIGYTNAGKSTILNALTKSTVLAENKLFSTLDTTTRELFINNVKKGLISDTVGFIQQLPHLLVEAFKSTLTELNYASLLIQVIDLSDPNWPVHCEVVANVLKELHVDKPMIYVFNKKDKVKDLTTIESKLFKYEPHVIVSATEPDGLKPLIDFLDSWK